MMRLTMLIAVLNLFGTGLVSVAPTFAATAPPKPVTGCLNQQLTDGFWTLKVTSATLGTLPGETTPAWGVTFDFGNAQAKAASPNTLGVDVPQLILKDGTTLDMTTDSGLHFQHALEYTTLQPGGKKSGTYWYVPDDPTTKAATFLFPVDANNSVYNTPYGYPVKNPAFSVDLTCTKS